MRYAHDTLGSYKRDNNDFEYEVATRDQNIPSAVEFT
jgi:hypothetical protein